jgi:hypothetical protein
VFPLSVRATAILGASGSAAPRRATNGGATQGTSDGDAPEAGRQAVTALRSGWAAAAHPRPGGNDGCARRGRRWQRRRW